ncbi:Gfo/Idh/MocA family protein [Chitinibacteraceae bacterium HSL-7]
MSSPVRFGIIGTGSIAGRFAAGLAHVPAAQAVAVYNRTSAKAQAFAAQHGIASVCDSLDALFAAGIDAVYIATPHPSHAPLSMAALEAGLAVLCEKPAAVTLAELDAVLATARRCGRLYMEAMKPPFFPLFEAVSRHIAAGDIGEVRFVRAGFANPGVPDGHAVLDPAQAGGGLLDIGIYAAFLAAHWLGPAGRVDVSGRLGASGVDTFAAIQTTHAGGMAQLYCGLDVSGAGDALIAGSRGHVVLHEKWWNPVRATLVTPQGREELALPAEGSGLNFETAHFCALLQAGQLESPVLSHATTRAALEMIAAARDAVMA